MLGVCSFFIGLSKDTFLCVIGLWNYYRFHSEPMLNRLLTKTNSEHYLPPKQDSVYCILGKKEVEFLLTYNFSRSNILGRKKWETRYILEFLKKCFIFYWDVLINSVVIVSGEQWRNSVIHICVSILPQTPSHTGHHTILSRVQCAVLIFEF